MRTESSVCLTKDKSFVSECNRILASHILTYLSVQPSSRNLASWCSMQRLGWLLCSKLCLIWSKHATPNSPCLCPSPMTDPSVHTWKHCSATKSISVSDIKSKWLASTVKFWGKSFQSAVLDNSLDSMAHVQLHIRFSGVINRLDIKDTVSSLYKPSALGTYRTESLKLHDLSFVSLHP